VARDSGDRERTDLPARVGERPRGWESVDGARGVAARSEAEYHELNVEQIREELKGGSDR
jgi:hypothetical protein